MVQSIGPVVCTLLKIVEQDGTSDGIERIASIVFKKSFESLERKKKVLWDDRTLLIFEFPFSLMLINFYIRSNYIVRKIPMEGLKRNLLYFRM